MKSKPNFLEPVLIGIVLSELLGCFFLRRELARIEASNAPPAIAALQDRLGAVDKEVMDLRKQRLILNARRPGKMAAGKADAALATKFADRYAEALKDPAFQALLRDGQRSGLDARYGDLFGRLKLDPVKAEKLKDLLVEKQTDKSDALLAARDTGVSLAKMSGAFRKKMLTDTQKDSDEKIRTLLGDAGYQDYQKFEASMPIRDTVAVLRQNLELSEQLTDAQANALVDKWYDLTPADKRSGAYGLSAETAAGLLPRSVRLSVPKEGLSAASQVLNPVQMDALQKIVSVQKAEERLRQMAAAAAKTKPR